MTAWQEVKKYGLSLKAVSVVSEVPITTLRDWFKSKPKLFEVVCRGVREVNNHCENCKPTSKELERLKLEEQFNSECG